MIYLIATLKIEPGSKEKVLAAAQPCIAATRQEEGCISYDLHQSLTDENTLVFVERWENREALDGHFKQSHMLAWREAAGQYFLDRKIEIIHPDKVEEL